MLIQLLQFAAILGAIALTPRLVTIELTHEGDDLWQAIKDRAPGAWATAKALYQTVHTALYEGYTGFVSPVPTRSVMMQQVGLVPSDPDDALSDRAADAAIADFDSGRYHDRKSPRGHAAEADADLIAHIRS